MADSSLPTKKLGEVLSVVETGSRPSGGASSGTFGMPSLGGENITLDGSLDLESVRYVTSDFFSSMRSGHLRPLDVLINKDGAQTGKVAIYCGEFPQAAINEHLYLLRGTDEIRQDYLYRVLLSEDVQRVIQSFITGSAQPGLNRRFIDIFIPVPSLGKQKIVVDALQNLDEVIRYTEDIVVKYESVRTGLASDLLDGRFKLQGDTGEYQKCRIGDLGSVVGGGTPSRDREKYWNGSIPWLTPGELTGIDDKFVCRSKERISELGLTASSARLVPAGSLLVTSRASIGFCALAGVDLATNQGFQNVIPNADSVDSSYLFYLGKTLRREMIRRASGTTFLEIPKREFERIKVQVPSLKEQRRVAKILDDISGTIQANRRQLEKLRQLRSGLAADLFSGKVRTVKV